MSRWYYAILFMLIVVLTMMGCNSFNKYELVNNSYQSTSLIDYDNGSHNTNDDDAPVSLPDLLPKDKVLEPTPTGVSCPVFKLPDIPKLPPLPLKELARIAPTDSAALDAIQQRHIEELRQHAAHVNKLVKTAYYRYRAECRSAIAEASK